MNIANRLTLLRILCVPIFLIFINGDSLSSRVAAFLVFLSASLTDIYDGRLARSQGIVTLFGTFMDPLADKLLVCAAFVSFVEIPTLSIPSWMAVAIISREFIMTGLRTLAAKKNIVVPASMAGKFKTVSQVIAIIAILLILIVEAALKKFYGLDSSALPAGNVWRESMGWTLKNGPYLFTFVATALTLTSAVGYITRNRRILFSE